MLERCSQGITSCIHQVEEIHDNGIVTKHTLLSKKLLTENVKGGIKITKIIRKIEHILGLLHNLGDGCRGQAVAANRGTATAVLTENVKGGIKITKIIRKIEHILTGTRI